jgi:hypothetical protein
LEHSRFSDIELAAGCEPMAARGIENGFRNSGNSVCCIMNSSVPNLVSMDTTQIADYLGAMGAKAVLCQSNGYESAQIGISSALNALADALLHGEERDSKRVDIIGYSDLGFGSPALLKPGVDALSDRGLNARILGSEPGFVWTLPCFNWVVSAEGIALADRIFSEYGVPYVVGLPYGESSRARWMSEIAVLTGRGWEVETPCFKPLHEMRRVMMIGQPVIMDALRHFLREERGFERIQCALYAPVHNMKELYRPFEQTWDMFMFASIEDLRGKADSPDIIMADPLLCDCLSSYFPSSAFFPLTDSMISGRFFLPAAWQRPGGLNIASSQ